jgi:hypothetical protein
MTNPEDPPRSESGGDEVVAVAQQDRQLDTVPVSTLSEKKRLEYYAAKQFLALYNMENHTTFRITVLRDAPDVECADLAGNPLYLEVATVFDRNTDAPVMLGRTAHRPARPREIQDAIQQANEVIASKTSMRYGCPNTVLVLRHAVPVFSGLDFRLQIQDFRIPESHGFLEIYLLAHREDGGVMHLGEDLVRLYPTFCPNFSFPNATEQP